MHCLIGKGIGRGSGRRILAGVVTGGKRER